LKLGVITGTSVKESVNFIESKEKKKEKMNGRERRSEGKKAGNLLDSLQLKQRKDAGRKLIMTPVRKRPLLLWNV
jgi:hypothetical protein